VKNEAFRRTNRSRPKLQFAIRGVGEVVERVVTSTQMICASPAAIRGYSAQRNSVYAREEVPLNVQCHVLILYIF